MCGIVGYIGRSDALGILVPALKRLEYRGYDSSGVATINGSGLESCRAVGKIANLEARLSTAPRPHGTLGIAHTRWATHGRPSDVNAHPQVDCGNHLAIVHNGIIENHRQLRASLAANGHQFRSQTDTEVIAHLIETHRAGSLPDAVRQAAHQLKGSYAVACIADDAPDMLVAVRSGSSPLLIGIGQGEILVASDLPALLGRSQEVVVLEEGEMAILTRDGIRIERLDGRPVERAPSPISSSLEAVERAGYPHFMLKEIFEQPEAVRQTLAEGLAGTTGAVDLPDVALTDRELAAFSRLCFVACGSSWHAALIGKELIEELARLPVEAAIASELRHRRPLFDRGVLTVPVSQSGETADTLSAMRQAREGGSHIAAITNTVGSSIARGADSLLYTRARLEIGVAATKTFTTQVAAVTLLALKLALARRTLCGSLLKEILGALATVPRLMEEVLGESEAIRAIAADLVERRHALYLGRGVLYPMALEGALKLKEISYIHAEGYPAGEMKHGPIALLDAEMPVVALATQGPWYDSMANNIQEVRARDGLVVALLTRGDDAIASLADVGIRIPPAPRWIQPFLTAIPLQLLAYHLAVLRGADVDQPRNLAKSVTVE